MNMMLTRKVQLVPAAGGKPINEVAGIKLDNLSTFNNYTLVGDGELTVPYLKVKISDKSLLREAGQRGRAGSGRPAGREVRQGRRNTRCGSTSCRSCRRSRARSI